MKILILYFWLMLSAGTITADKKENVHDRQTYTLKTADGKVYELVYTEEIIEYIETGTFEYNEDLE
jgi:hypothetical protein